MSAADIAEAQARIDPEEVRRRVDLVRMVEDRVKLTRKGKKGHGLCPFHNEKSPSFSVWEDHYHCFGCGAHGDAFTWYRDRYGVDFPTALRELAEIAGVVPRSGKVEPRKEVACLAQPLPEREVREAEERRKAAFVLDVNQRAWRAGVAAAATPVELYLRGRAIDPEILGGIPKSIRYGPRTRFDDETDLPAQLCGVQAADDRLCALHITYLTLDGQKAAVKPQKRMLGPCWRAAVRLSARTIDGRLYIGEGVETCLSVLQRVRAAGRDIAVWAALSQGNISGAMLPARHRQAHPTKRRIHPDTRRDLGPVWLPSDIPDPDNPGIILPGWCREVVILADADSDLLITEQHLRCAQRRWQHMPVFIARPTPGMDFNDMLIEAAA